ncbi:site-specific integrase [Frankia sp. AvcI1]|uniref:tyrosine-type recombinase/integrase n=1 Tax=Frankia sp. AvcI1 TaxID=573496 RepID=UPI002118F4E7|nr:site-specific integrase [Frankia sp. AvcI1]
MSIEDRWFNKVVDPMTGKITREKAARHNVGRRWRVHYTDPEGKGRSKSFHKRGPAEDFDRKVNIDVTEGRWIDPVGPKTPFEVAADEWIRNRSDLSHNAFITYETRLKMSILPRWGKVSIGTISPIAIREWLTELGNEYSPKTISLTFMIFQSVMIQAVLDKRIPASPCTAIKSPAIRLVPVMPLPLIAAHALIAAAPDHLRLVPALAAFAGVRQGEALGLTEDRVNVLHQVFTIDRQRAGRPGLGQCLAPTKNPSSDRVQPIPDRLASAFTFHLERLPPRPIRVTVFRERGRSAKGETHTVRPIFRTSNDTLLSGANFGQQWTGVWQQAVADLRALGTDAGAIAADALEVDHSLHDLRHLYASTLIAGGADVKDTQRAMGHASASTTLDVYGHLWPGSEDRIRGVVDAMWSREVDAGDLINLADRRSYSAAT